MREEEIKRFFDEKSIDRNLAIDSDPIRKYEQDMRQRAVIALLNPSKDDLILDLGCGNVRDLIVFAMKGAKYVGIDLSSEMIKEGKKDITRIGLKTIDLIVGSGTFLPFKDESFDKISCSEVIEHIPNYDDAIVEMIRVLKKGGSLVITTPNWHSLYGITRRLIDFIKLIKNKKRSHPYDEWKTQKEVINILEKHDMVINIKRAICFIPGQLTYILPRNLKKLIVTVFFYIEKKVRDKLTGKGYSMGISAIKK